VTKPTKTKGVGIFIALTKAPKLLKLLKVASFAKFLKPFVSILTLSISTIAYAFWLGPWLGILLALHLFWHEYGHVLALKRYGHELKWPVYIPFLGALVFAPKFNDRREEAVVAIMGPFAGFILALVLYLSYFFVPQESTYAMILLAGAYIGVYLNLFNLIPIGSLDGGRVTQTLGTWFTWVGIALLGLLTVSFMQPFILYIWILVMVDMPFPSVKVKGILAPLLWVAMTALMSLGYSSQPWWIDLIDIVFGGLVSMLMMHQARYPDLVQIDTRPKLSRREQQWWFIAWAGLVAVLVGMFFLMSPQLEIIKEQIQATQKQ
jgi:Zn-dependent protease